MAPRKAVPAPVLSPPRQGVVAALCVAALVVGAAPGTRAKPVAPEAFCERYPDAPLCVSGATSCTTCHTTAPARNIYGVQLESELAPAAPRPLSDEDFLAGLDAALAAVEHLDADGDAADNLAELLAGSILTDPTSTPFGPNCDAAFSAVAASPDNRWNTCAYDPAHAFRKVSLDVCGRSATLDEVAAFDAAADWQQALADALDRCLSTPYWRGVDGVLWSLANTKIRPSSSIKSGVDGGDIPLGDYYDDYNLFVYTQSEDRDAREVLTAQYFVERGADDVLTPFVRTPSADFAVRGFGSTQLVPEERRAGMLTTRWFLVANTMFTPIPRTTAAQAYRSYLGFDVAKLEGIVSVAGEPTDFDRKGVTDPTCAACHTTLDPLSYPFSRYDGLGGGEGAIGPAAAQGRDDIVNADGSLNIDYANYVPDRLDRFITQEGAQIVETPEAGVILGTPVADLVEWAEVAANSDAFARATVLDYWRLFMGEDPRPDELEQLEQLVEGFRTVDGYQIERMLHALIRTEAYGVP